MNKCVTPHAPASVANAKDGRAEQRRTTTSRKLRGTLGVNQEKG
jgi:hypothetical protein